MRVWKRTTAVVCSLLITLCGVYPAVAVQAEDIAPLGLTGEEPQPKIPMEPEAAASFRLTGGAEKSASKIAVQPAQLLEPILLTLPLGGDVESLDLSGEVFAYYGRFTALDDLPVDWRLEDFDASKTGRQDIVGEVILPEGYAYYDESGEEAVMLIRRPVWVYSPDMEERETLSVSGPVYRGPVVFPLEADIAEAKDLLSECAWDYVSLWTQDNYLIKLDCHCDWSAVDFTKAGIYYPFRFELPPGLVAEEADLRHQYMSVYVVDPSRVDLSGAYRQDENSYAAGWIYEAQNPSIWIAAKASQEEEYQWLMLEEYEDIGIDGATLYVSFDSTWLNIYFRAPYPEDAELWFQVRYDGGESNYLCIEIEDGGLSYGEPRVGDRIGDKDGNQTPPDNPEPEPPGPDNPKDPGDPQSPDNPGPKDPDPDSGTPEKPGPSEPQNPDNPDPKDPGPDSGTPEKPGQSEPQNPDNPDPKDPDPDPSTPEKPGPSEPQNPDNPDPKDPAPDSGTPEKPGPSEPQNPDNPETPAPGSTQPGLPGKPNTGAPSSDSAGSDTQDTGRESRTGAGTGPEMIRTNAVAAGAAVPQPPAKSRGLAVPVPNAEEPGAVLDPSQMDGTAYTGAQLRVLMERKSEYVPFWQDDVQVWLPTGALSTLTIGDADVFAVRVHYLPGKSLTVLLTINNEPISLSEAFTVAIPWDGKEVLCHDAGGAAVPFEHDAGQGLLLLTFLQPGTVYISMADSTEAEPSGLVEMPAAITPAADLPLEAAKGVPFAAFGIGGVVGAVGIGGAAVFRYKRRPRR